MCRNVRIRDREFGTADEKVLSNVREVAAYLGISPQEVDPDMVEGEPNTGPDGRPYTNYDLCLCGVDTAALFTERGWEYDNKTDPFDDIATPPGVTYPPGYLEELRKDWPS